MLEQVFEQYNAMKMKVKALLLAVIAALTGYYSYQDSVETAQTNLQQAKQAEEQLSNELNSFSKGGQSVTAIEAQIRKSQEELAQLFELIPKSVEIDRLIANFADAARDSGVSMIRFAPTPTTGPASQGNSLTGSATGTSTASSLQAGFVSENLKDFSISVTLEGTFPQTVLFFDKVLSLPRVVQLKKFNFTPATQLVSVAMPQGMKAGEAQKTRVNTDNSPILKVDAQFTAFMQKENAQISMGSKIKNPSNSVSNLPKPPSGMSAKPVPGGAE
jgi:Tfp pilus assembly protein PilO